MSLLSERLLIISSNGPSDIADLKLTAKDVDLKLRELEDFYSDKIGKLTFDCDEYLMASNLIGCLPTLSNPLKVKLLNTLATGLSRSCKLLLSKDKSAVEAIEAICLLSYSAIVTAEKHTSSSSSSSSATTSNKKNLKSEVLFDWNHLKIVFATAFKSLSNEPSLLNLYSTYSEMEHLIGIIVKSVHLLVENVENYKISQLRELCSDTLATCASNLQYKNGLQIVITQDLSYLEHLAEFDAQVLIKMIKFYDNSSLLDSILQSIGSIKFHPDDSTSSSKIICTFLLKISILSPADMLRNVAVVADLIESEVPGVRMSLLEIFAILYCHLMLREERTEQNKVQAQTFLSAIEERLRDVNAFVRSKSLQVLGELLQTNAIPINDRSILLKTVVGRVLDKSSNVRKRAIQLLGEFLRRHPFCVDGGELSLDLFTERLAEVEQNIDRLEPADVKNTMSNSLMDIAEEVMEKEQEEDAQAKIDKMNSLQQLLMQKRYYTDAIEFVKRIDSIIPTLCRLLSSHTKTEVFEVMDFFVDSSIYKVQSAAIGVKKMLHLIWEQDLSTEDGTKRSVKEHVMLNYRRIYLEVDAKLSGKEKVLAVAKNLINFTNECNMRDLPSLEQLIYCFMEKGWISDAVIQAIGLHILHNKHDEQRGAVMLVSMMGAKRIDIISSRIESLIKVGLGNAALNDPILMEHALIALSRLSGTRLASDNIIFSRIAAVIKIIPVTSRWLQVINGAVKCIYALAHQPSLIVGELIHHMAAADLGKETSVKTVKLIKLIYLVGCVASAELVNFDSIEKHLKSRRKATLSEKEINNEMAGITATEDEDISENLRQIREQELLYGNDSILAVFGPLVITICSNSSSFSDRQLQNVATLTLTKLMTLSSEFCNENLPLFLTLLEKSPDAIIRGNLTVAFADLVQSYNRIVDSNIIYLFNRLKDSDVRVRRNALLVLTHLTLTGMIKLKGQVGEIAKCILDKDPRVAELARQFFHELASKDNTNALYNHIPDILSCLSQQSSEEAIELTENEIQIIVRFIFEYVKKERQMEGLLEKICQRLHQCSTVRQSRDMACCLVHINYTSDRTVKRLINSFPLYKDKLVDSTVYSHVIDALQKARKSAKGVEMKNIIDDFERRLVEAGGNREIMEIDSTTAVEDDVDHQKIVTAGREKGGRVPARRTRRGITMPRGAYDSDDDTF